MEFHQGGKDTVNHEVLWCPPWAGSLVLSLRRACHFCLSPRREIPEYLIIFHFDQGKWNRKVRKYLKFVQNIKNLFHFLVHDVSLESYACPPFPLAVYFLFLFFPQLLNIFILKCDLNASLLSPLHLWKINGIISFMMVERNAIS